VKGKARLTEGPVGRGLFFLSLPMVVGFFAIMAFNLADTFFVAQLGTSELAAMGFIFPVVVLIISFVLGLGMGVASVISRAIGEGDHQKVRRYTTDSLILAILVVILFVFVGLITINPLFTLLGATAEILPLIRQYMTIWYLGMMFVVFPLIGNNAIRATGDTKYPSLIMIISASVNVVLDPFLIFGWAGFPRLELAGAALATVIARSISMTCALLILHFRERMLDFSWPRLVNVWDSWKKILYIGIPSAATNILRPISMAVIVRMVAGFGPPAVAAIGAGQRVEAFALLVVIALAASLIPFIGQNWGARKFERVRSAQNYSYLFSFFWGIFCLGVFLITAAPIARLFSKEEQVITGIVAYLCIVSVGYGMQGISVLVAGVLNAINRPLDSAFVNFFRMFVLYIPLAYFGSVLFGLGGIFTGIVLANVIAGIVSLYWVRNTCKREKAKWLEDER
jgi:putative MATE family efflux protein